MPYKTTDPTDPRVTYWHNGTPPPPAAWLPDLGLGTMAPLPATTEAAIDCEGQAAAYRAAWAATVNWDAEREQLNACRLTVAGDATAVELRRKHLAAGLEVLAALRAAAEAVRPMAHAAFERLAATVADTPPAQLAPAVARRLAAADTAYTQVQSLLGCLIGRAERWVREALGSLPPSAAAVGPSGACLTPSPATLTP